MWAHRNAGFIRQRPVGPGARAAPAPAPGVGTAAPAHPPAAPRAGAVAPMATTRPAPAAAPRPAAPAPMAVAPALSPLDGILAIAAAVVGLLAVGSVVYLLSLFQ